MAFSENRARSLMEAINRAFAPDEPGHPHAGMQRNSNGEWILCLQPECFPETGGPEEIMEAFLLSDAFAKIQAAAAEHLAEPLKKEEDFRVFPSYALRPPRPEETPAACPAPEDAAVVQLLAAGHPVLET